MIGGGATCGLCWSGVPCEDRIPGLEDLGDSRPSSEGPFNEKGGRLDVSIEAGSHGAGRRFEPREGGLDEIKR